MNEKKVKEKPILEILTEIVNEQAEDDGLWFIAMTASEQYLQNALRRLHAEIEDDAIGRVVAGEAQTKEGIKQ